MTHYLLNTLTIVGVTLQATVSLGFLAAVSLVGLTAFGILPAPL